MKPERKQILEDAIDATCGDREKTYGDPKVGMECLGELMSLFGKYGKAKSKAHDATVAMILVKLSRIITGNLHRDNYVDLAAYAGIAWEVSEKQTLTGVEE